MVGMTLFRRKAAVIIAGLPVLLTGFATAQTAVAPAPATVTKSAAVARPKHHGVSKPSPAVPEPPPPAPPPTPAQMPPTTPQVTYSNGLLTIVANNSTLSDVLHAVASTHRRHSGGARTTDLRAGGAAHIGPASPREVLTDLLTGPGFDYILVGSDADPNGVRNIILTPNQPSGGASVAMAQPAPQPAPAAEQEDDDDDQASAATSPPTGRVEPQPSPGRRQFTQPQPPDQTAQPAQPAQPTGEGGNPQQVKTPEQLLEQLRKMQQPPQQQTDQR